MLWPFPRRLFRAVAIVLLVIGGAAKTARGAPRAWHAGRGAEVEQVQARVEISPGQARRSAPDPTIAVWLEDARGRHHGGIATCSIAVTFNGVPVSLRWERTPDWLAARLPRRTIRGLVRVEVRTATGRLLGSESFELAPRHVRARMWRHRAVVQVHRPALQRTVQAHARLSAT